jgi:hypothetical protein
MADSIVFQSAPRSFWNAVVQTVGWEGLSFIVLFPLALGFVAMAKFRAARIFFALASLMLAIKIVSSVHAYLPDQWVPLGELVGAGGSIILFCGCGFWWTQSKRLKTLFTLRYKPRW